MFYWVFPCTRFHETFSGHPQKIKKAKKKQTKKEKAFHSRLRCRFGVLICAVPMLRFPLDFFLPSFLYRVFLYGQHRQERERERERKPDGRPISRRFAFNKTLAPDNLAASFFFASIANYYSFCFLIFIFFKEGGGGGAVSGRDGSLFQTRSDPRPTSWKRTNKLFC